MLLWVWLNSCCLPLPGRNLSFNGSRTNHSNSPVREEGDLWFAFVWRQQEKKKTHAQKIPRLVKEDQFRFVCKKKIWTFMMPSLGTKKKENPARMDRYTGDLPQVGFSAFSLSTRSMKVFSQQKHNLLCPWLRQETKISRTARGSRLTTFINVKPVQLEATKFWLSWPVWATDKQFNFLISALSSLLWVLSHGRVLLYSETWQTMTDLRTAVCSWIMGPAGTKSWPLRAAQQFLCNSTRPERSHA